MPRPLKLFVSRILLVLLRIAIILIKIPYWILLKLFLAVWGSKGLHAIAVGQFVGGKEKTRSTLREEMLIRAIPMFVNMKDKNCLDLACNDGYWAFRFARYGLRQVVGVDFESQNIARAKLLQIAYDIPRFRFIQSDIFEFLKTNSSTHYDIVFLLSIIYHLPADTDWKQFFADLSSINDECLIIDSRWFDNDDYWYDRSGHQAILMKDGTPIPKWRPTRTEICQHLTDAGYVDILDINPSAFIQDQEAAQGNGNPYTLDNIADYLTGNRTLLIAFKQPTKASGILTELQIERRTVPE